ncbi:ATP-binding protein [Massilia sp. R798]|uniref:ATP-binding protein n=2 Tax=Massilia soli TaxID=2792854 RepID=A0ABS7SRI0_9BURK|nr:ATP-binding protein [Massilia soli]
MDAFAAATKAAASAFVPPPPRTVNETGLPFIFLVELAVKVLFLRGLVRLVELASHMKLSVSVLDPMMAFMRTEKLCEVTRIGSSGTDADIAYKLTDLGRSRGVEYLNRCGYAGPAPVTLECYSTEIRARSVASLRIARAAVLAEFGDIVVNAGVLDQLGAAMNSGRAMFIHGPAGSGKTYLAERLAGLLTGTIGVPHAVYAGGEVIQMYDPVVHRPPEAGSGPENAFHPRQLRDARWVTCLRPAVLTGGELTLDMLDLKFDETTRYYQAPPHLKANNGIFIIDDLGRQRCSPTDLLNRWIVPMDRKTDFLSLHTGYKFEVPFDVIVVFSSNLPPADLGDGAFLRRIGYKIHVGPMSERDYREVFMRACDQHGIARCDDTFAYLVREHHQREGRPMLACYPRDLLSQVRDKGAYEGEVPQLTPAAIQWAWNNYFSGAGDSHIQGD